MALSLKLCWLADGWYLFHPLWMTVIFQSSASGITYYDILGATYCTLMRLLSFFEARLLLAFDRPPFVAQTSRTASWR